jgi:hypothetical protein
MQALNYFTTLLAVCLVTADVEFVAQTKLGLRQQQMCSPMLAGRATGEFVGMMRRCSTYIA